MLWKYKFCVLVPINYYYYFNAPLFLVTSFKIRFHQAPSVIFPLYQRLFLVETWRQNGRISTLNSSESFYRAQQTYCSQQIFNWNRSYTYFNPQFNLIGYNRRFLPWELFLLWNFLSTQTRDVTNFICVNIPLVW